MHLNLRVSCFRTFFRDIKVPISGGWWATRVVKFGIGVGEPRLFEETPEPIVCVRFGLPFLHHWYCGDVTLPTIPNFSIRRLWFHPKIFRCYNFNASMLCIREVRIDMWQNIEDVPSTVLPLCEGKPWTFYSHKNVNFDRKSPLSVKIVRTYCNCFYFASQVSISRIKDTPISVLPDSIRIFVIASFPNKNIIAKNAVPVEQFSFSSYSNF